VAFCEHKQLKEHAAYPNAWKVVQHLFHLVKLEDVDWLIDWDYKHIIGLRSLQSITFVWHGDVVLLKMQELTCFCSKCMDDNFELC
jgi:hypothetical protein